MDTTNVQEELQVQEELPNLLTIRQTAEVLNISKSMVYKLVRQEKLAAIHMGRCLRIKRGSVLEYGELV